MFLMSEHVSIVVDRNAHATAFGQRSEASAEFSGSARAQAAARMREAFVR